MRKFNFDNLDILNGEYDVLDQLWIDAVTALPLDFPVFAPQPGPLFATVNGTPGDDTLNGTSGDDVINGFAGDDILRGFEGNDTLIGGAGADQHFGGVGNDTASYVSASSGVELDLGFGGTAGDANGDTFFGIENIIGSDFDDVMLGSANADDNLSGAGGDDILQGRDGNDTLDGGDGIDTAVYSSANANDYQIVEIAAGEYTVTTLFGNDGTDTLTGIETIRLGGIGGTDFDIDTLVVTGIITGTNGDDTLVGQRGETVYGLFGDDTITAFDGDVVVDAGGGSDMVEIRPDSSGDGFTVDGGNGTWIDTLIITTSGIEADNYFGGVFSLLSNTLDSGDYANFSVVDFSRLIMTGGGYSDTLYGGQQDDILDDGAGFFDSGLDNSADILYGYNGNDILTAHGGDDEVYGGNGDDIIRGGIGNNILEGGDGDDYIISTGNDVINGGSGSDIVEIGQAVRDTSTTISGFGSSTIAFEMLLDIQDGSGISVSLLTVDLGAGTYSQSRTDTSQVLFTDSFISFSHARGSNFSDDITGTASTNVLRGNGGDDILNGLGGSDRLMGGAGDDIINGGDGIDYVFTGSANRSDYLIEQLTFTQYRITALNGVDEGVDIVNDVEYIRFGDEFGQSYFLATQVAGAIELTNGDDVYTGTAGDDVVNALDGDDIVTGGAGDDILAGGDGNDVLQGGEGADQLYGGFGSDTADYSDATSRIIVDLEAGTTGAWASGDYLDSIESIIGSDFNDIIRGSSSFSGTYSGGDGNDSITARGNLLGGDGADILVALSLSSLTGGAGDDSLIGTGSTSANYASHSYDYHIITQSGGGVSSIISLVTDEGTDALTSISDLGFSNVFLGINDTFPHEDTLRIGTEARDIFRPTGTNNILMGFGGPDIFDNRGGRTMVDYSWADAGVTASLDSAVTQTGAAANTTYSRIDDLGGTTFDDGLYGDEDDNFLRGLDGADTLDGGEGDDELFGGAGDDILLGGLGADSAIYATSDINDLTITLVAAGQYSVVSSTGEGTDMLTDVEFIRLGGTNGTDIDITTLTNSNDLTPGDDVWTGTTGDDVINGLAGNDTLNGLAGNDTLSGDEGDDFIDGGMDDDILNGGDGMDQLFGGEGLDILDGGDGNDQLFGGPGDDLLTGGAGDDAINGGSGTDTAIYSSANAADYLVTETAPGEYTVTALNGVTDGVDTLVGVETIRLGGINGTDYAVASLVSNGTITLTTGDDVYSGTSADLIINALAGDDIIDGGAGNNTLNGDAGDDILISLGNDILNGGTGNDTVEMGGNVFDAATTTDGGAGLDTISFSTLAQLPSGNIFLVLDLQGQAYSVRDGSTILYVDSFSNFENATGSEAGDLLQGDAGSNVLLGLGGDDNLQGREGDDIIDGGAGADIFNGGIGTDTASYASALAGLTAIMSDAALNTGDAAGDSYIEIENITGSDFNDVLGGDANANIIDGGAGFDIASYQLSSAAIVFDGLGLVAASGDIAADTVVNIEAIRGTDFNDRFFGGNDASIYYGGAGADRLFGRNGDDELYGEDGNDIILAGRDNDLIDGGAGNDQLRGNEGDDIIFGGDGNDAITGGAGADAMDGGAGIDRVEYTYGTNAGVTASLGNSAINTGDAAGDTYVNIENLYGTTFMDTLYGDAGNNRIDGRGGDDMLFGGYGNDYLIGGAGNDVMNGEGGNDLFLGQAGADIYQFDAAHGTDRIVVFTQGEDLIEFTEGVFDFSGLTITQDGAHVNIVSSEGTIISNNSLVADFTAADFIFATPPSNEPLGQNPLDDDLFAQDMTDLMAMDFEALI